MSSLLCLIDFRAGAVLLDVCFTLSMLDERGLATNVHFSSVRILIRLRCVPLSDFPHTLDPAYCLLIVLLQNVLIDTKLKCLV